MNEQLLNYLEEEWPGLFDTQFDHIILFKENLKLICQKAYELGKSNKGD